MLELPRGGKIRAQDAGVRAARGEIVAFSDANAVWEPDALAAPPAAFPPTRASATPAARSASPTRTGTNQEGLYWRYEMWIRGLESHLASVTGGNGAIYATRREAYIEVDPIMGHDLSFPFNMVKRGWRAVYVPSARAEEKMVPSIEGEFARKRRMMSHAWPILLRGGLLSPRGYGPLYAWMIFSHRVLRYASPFLHLIALPTSIALAAAGAGWIYVLAAAAPGRAAPRGGPGPRRARPPAPRRALLRLTTASLAAGLWDWLRDGTAAGWEPAEGTR